jgi:hypothetical protein
VPWPDLIKKVLCDVVYELAVVSLVCFFMFLMDGVGVEVIRRPGLVDERRPSFLLGQRPDVLRPVLSGRRKRAFGWPGRQFAHRKVGHTTRREIREF